jgi:hypothetical protein
VGGRLAIAAAALVAGAGFAAAALGGTAAIPAASALPSSDPAHRTPLELLAGTVATQIAGRPVTVHCEADADWAALVDARGGDPGSEEGYLGSTWDTGTGLLVELSSTIELSGSSVCLPLQRFAAAAAKPTTCPARRGGRTRPCYLGNGRPVAPMTPSFWDEYAREATAMLTLAHESVHAGGTVGGRLANGLAVGDQQAEAKAECYGLQLVAYVAERLGDTFADARSIASYLWDEVYGPEAVRSPAYWSPDCRPGGTLDMRPAGASQAWP